ncbi:MAG: metallophosphoesterase [Clostridia bacterium]|nr:metallophosphoesterase [Clostridia bacterium]
MRLFRSRKPLCALALLVVVLTAVSAFAAPEPEERGADAFSVIWISDTQSMTEKPTFEPGIERMFSWIAENAEAERIAAVVHTGDVVENGWNERQWERIEKGIAKLPEDLPFIVAAGNHDVAKRKVSYERWLGRDFVRRYDAAHTYRGGAGVYRTVDAGEVKLLFVAIGYGSMDEDGFAWMREVLDAHPDHIGIVLAHSILSYNNRERSTYTREGRRLMEEVAAKCDNVRLMLCGHVPGTTRTREVYPKGDGFRTVDVLRYNYQDRKTPKYQGYLRILRFEPTAGSLESITYSPVHDSFRYDWKDAANEHFVIPDFFPKAP